MMFGGGGAPPAQYAYQLQPQLGQQPRYDYAHHAAPSDPFAAATALADVAATKERAAEALRHARGGLLSEATASGESYVAMLTNGLGLPREVADARLAEARTTADPSSLPRAAQIFRQCFEAYEAHQRVEIAAVEDAHAARRSAEDGRQRADRSGYAGRGSAPVGYGGGAYAQPHYAPQHGHYAPQPRYGAPPSHYAPPPPQAHYAQQPPPQQSRYSDPMLQQPAYKLRLEPAPVSVAYAGAYGQPQPAAVPLPRQVGGMVSTAELEAQARRLGIVGAATGGASAGAADAGSSSSFDLLRRACEECGVSVCTGPRRSALQRQKREALKDAYALITSDWGLPTVEEGVQLWRKKVPGANVDPMLCEGVVHDIEPRLLARLLTDESFKRQSDASIEQLRAIEVVDEWTCVWHQEDRYFWPLANRDNVYLCTIQERANGSVLVVEQTIKDHPFVPKSGRCVRVDSFFACVASFPPCRVPVSFVSSPPPPPGRSRTFLFVAHHLLPYLRVSAPAPVPSASALRRAMSALRRRPPHAALPFAPLRRRPRAGPLLTHALF